ncbi:MAG: mechanosensitive ion channel family protein [bacterium]|nr:mechanosensitive ion channel family protein [bacterium]
MSREHLEDLIAVLGSDPWVRAILILAGSAVAAKVAELMLARALPVLTRRTRTELDDRAFALLRGPVSASILLIGIHLALLLLAVPEPFDRYARSILATVAILLWLGFALRFTRLVLGALSRNHERFNFVQPQTLPVLENAATVILVAGGIYFLLLAWSVSVSGWLASAGVAGLALGLAAKDTLANLFAGVSILADEPFTVGDFIVLETGERGEIARIGIRSSRLLTRDDLEIIIPNSVLANSKIINEAGGPARHRRVRIKLQVAYGSDLDRVRELLLEIARDHPGVRREPDPRVRFRAFEDSGLRLELLAWVEEPVLRGRVIDALNSEIYSRFEAEGIEFPYPKRDLYVRQMSDLAAPDRKRSAS